MDKRVAAGKRHRVLWSYLRGVAKENVDIKNIAKQNNMPECKHCGSSRVVRYGYYSGIQRWWCKECKRKFADNEAPPGMKTPEAQIAFTLSMYYEGIGLKVIRRNLQQMYNSYVSDSTIYEWIERFTKKAIPADKKYQPIVGDVWFADETPLEIGNQKVRFWDILDIKTRFFLASLLSTRRTNRNIKTLMNRAVKKAGKLPKVVVTSQLTDYINNVELTLGNKTKYVTAKTLHTTAGTQLTENIHTTLKARTKIMRGFKTLKGASNIIKAWPIHYNYLRPHEVLHNNTPAQKAGIKEQLKIKIR